MNSLVEMLTKYAVVRALLLVMVGLLMLFAPDTMTHLTIYVMAACMGVMGITGMVGAMRREAENPFMQYDFVTGVLTVIAAILVATFVKPLVSILPIFFGIIAILGGTSYLLQGISYHNEGGRVQVMLWVFAALFILAGIVVILNPFQTLMMLFKAVGLMLIVYGISEGVTWIMLKK